MKRRRTSGPMGSGLNAHMDDQAIPLQQQRTVRRCQRKIGALMDELNEVAKQLATIWMSYPPKATVVMPLGHAISTIDVMLYDGEATCGWLDDWLAALQEQAKGERP